MMHNNIGRPHEYSVILFVVSSILARFSFSACTFMQVAVLRWGRGHVPLRFTCCPQIQNSAGSRELEAPRVSPSRRGMGLGRWPCPLNFFYIKMACSVAL